MQFLWFPITLFCAFCLATSDALTKRALAVHNEYLLAWFRLLLMVPWLILLVFAVPLPQIGSEFVTTLLIALPLELAALILYFKALKLSPLGVTVPFLAVTPVLLLVVPYLVLGERISTTGGAGIVLIAAGSYALHLGKASAGILAPLQAIARERGSLCMIGVAVIFSLTATLCKKGISQSSPLFFAGLYPILVFLVLTPVALWKGRRDLGLIRQSGIMRAALLPSLFTLMEVVTGIVALSMTNVAYMIAVKRLSLLMGVLYGHVLFGEADVRERLTGGSMMVGGVALIMIGGS